MSEPTTPHDASDSAHVDVAPHGSPPSAAPFADFARSPLYESLNVRSREDMEYLLAGISPRRRAFNASVVGSFHAAGNWLRRHWLGVVNGALATYVGLAVLTPIGFMVGLDGPASAVFRAYRFVCDELPSHSFFVGGYQMCLCARCLAIYSSMLLTGLFLVFMQKRAPVRGITWWMWLLAMVPMALDGGTQLFGLRESNPGLRLLTGALFGIATAMFALPQIAAAARGEELAFARRRA